MNIKNSIQTERGAEILLIFVLVARSTSFVMSKVTMNAMNPFNLLGVRFLLLSASLYPIWEKACEDQKTDPAKGIAGRTGLFLRYDGRAFYAPADSLIYIIFFGKYGDRICTDL